jgi:L-lactate dehydrogenase
MLETNIQNLAASGASADREAVRAAFAELRAALSAGTVRAAEPDSRSPVGWRVNTWVKQGILLGFRFGDMADASTSDVVVITAGLRRKPEESRLDLINRNVDLFLGLLDQVKTAGLKPNAYLVVVSNPVDVLTYLAVQRSGLPWQRVIGLGTQLDTARFRSYLARRLQVPPTQVQALILGEHGDSMVPIWSNAQIGGLPLEKFPGVTPVLVAEVEKKTRGSGAEVIKKKGGAGFAVGVSIADVIHSMALDQRRILPVSSLQTGAYGLRDVAISVPTVVGRKGVLGTIEIELWPKEKIALQNSAGVLRETISKVL